MVATYLKKIMHSVICVHKSDVYSMEIISVFFVDQVSWLVENFNIGIYLDTMNVVNVKLCLMVLLIELYLFISLLVTLTIFQGHCNVKQF